uniref:Ankyrin-1 n=1 Tax=Talaromyces marneffei PM1 TaxID=1077442 RepID=A0A093VTR4_TALMA
MAEAIAVLGVAAAALQFADVGYRVISRCSFLMKNSREYPDYLQRTHSQMQHLIYLAKVAAENRDTSQAIVSSEPQDAVDEHQQIQSTINGPEPPVVISTRMETIWKDCAHQADVIDNALQSMMREIKGRGLIGKWRQLSLGERVYSIEKALGELERSKTTLGLWLGNESLYRLGQRTLSRMFEEYHKKTENGVLPMIQPTLANGSPDTDTCDKQTKNMDFRNDREGAQRVRAVVNKPGSEVMQRSSATGQGGSSMDYSSSPWPNPMKVEWSKTVTVAGNTIVLQLGSHGKKSITFANKDAKNMFLNVYMRLRMAWISNLVELNFSLQHYPGAPSVQASLRTLIRVKSLPLERFFWGIYAKPWTRACPIPTQEEQLHLFSVARKLLLEKFYAGDAFPNAINADGFTLLHLQAALYSPGYETLFTKMTDFLLSTRVDTDMVDKYFRLLHSKEGTSHTVVAESRLKWTGFVGNKVINRRITLTASEVLRLIRYWPEAIPDTEYDQICDIVLRKSIDDLQNLRSWKETSISPLHFAAAASWPAGVRALISMGYSRFQVDAIGESPLDIAVDVGCISSVEALLKGDCLGLLGPYMQNRDTILPLAFLKAAASNDSRLHDIIVECLLRHNFLLPRLLPYHDLASRLREHDVINFAEKLFISGFQDIEAYDRFGYTPLMIACVRGDIKMASFLLHHGADPMKFHEHARLRAGHFLCYAGQFNMRKSHYSSYFVTENGFRSRDDEKRLLEAAFDTSIDIGSRCRCSPDSFTPITFLFRNFGQTSTYHLKKSFQMMLRNLDCSPADIKRYWRAFVVCETFNRLGMTHTCLTMLPMVLPFPDNRRIEIEDEEEELFFQLEEVVARFDLFSENRQDDLSNCMDEFFDDLDLDLGPKDPFVEYPSWSHAFDDCLGPGEYLPANWYISSRGKPIQYGYKEIIKEESMLRWLFP